MTGSALAIVVIAFAAVRSTFLRGRLTFAIVLLVGAGALDVVLGRGLGDPALIGGFARLLLVAGSIVAAVSLLFNP